MTARDNQLRSQHARQTDKQRVRRSGASEAGGATVSGLVTLDKQGRITITDKDLLDWLERLFTGPLVLEPGSPRHVQFQLDPSMQIVKNRLAARPSVEDIQNDKGQANATARQDGLMSKEDKAILDALVVDVDGLEDSLTNAVVDISTIETDLATAQFDIASLQTAVGVAETDIDTLQADVSNLQSSVTGIIAELADTHEVTVGSDTTLDPANKIVLVSNAGGSVLIDLNTDGGAITHPVTFIVIAWNALNTITIDDIDAKNINGAASQLLVGLYATMTVHYSANRDEWFIVT